MTDNDEDTEQEQVNSGKVDICPHSCSNWKLLQIALLSGIGSVLVGSTCLLVFAFSLDNPSGSWDMAWMAWILYAIYSAFAIIPISVCIALPLMCVLRNASNLVWVIVSLASGICFAILFSITSLGHSRFLWVAGCIGPYAGAFGLIAITLRQKILRRGIEEEQHAPTT